MARRVVEPRHGDVIVEEPQVIDHREAEGAEHERVTTHEDSWTVVRGSLRMFNALVAFVMLLIETVLAFRLGFALGGANRDNGFVEFIYDVSKPFIAPFEGIAAHEVDGRTVFEPETVIAMAVWLVVALLIVAAVNILLMAPAPTRSEGVTRERRAHYDRSI